MKWIWKALALLMAVLFAVILIAPSVDLDDFVNRSLSSVLLLLLALATLLASCRPADLLLPVFRTAIAWSDARPRTPSRPALCTLQC